MQYRESMQQLQGIVRRIESSEIDVDELAAAVRDANKLIAECRSKLRGADEAVAKAIGDIRDDPSTCDEDDEAEAPMPP